MSLYLSSYAEAPALDIGERNEGLRVHSNGKFSLSPSLSLILLPFIIRSQALFVPLFCLLPLFSLSLFSFPFWAPIKKRIKSPERERKYRD